MSPRKWKLCRQRSGPCSDSFRCLHDGPGGIHQQELLLELMMREFKAHLTRSTLEAIREVERIVRWQWFAWGLRWEVLDIEIENDGENRKVYIFGHLRASRFRWSCKRRIYVDAVYGFRELNQIGHPGQSRLLRVHSHLYVGKWETHKNLPNKPRWWVLKPGEFPRLSA